MSGYVLARRARRDLKAIYDYGHERWDRSQADRYARALFDAFGNIAAGAVRSRRVAAEYKVDGYLYALGVHFIYWRRQRSGRVEIVAVIDQRRLQSPLVKLAFGLPR